MRHGILPGVMLGAVLAGHAAAQTGTAESCARLTTLRLEAGAITLPTTGAAVTEASVVNDANGSYCRVRGAILPVDPAAPRILFQANLPAQWNGRAVQYGGGGYNGVMPNTTGHVTLGHTDTPTPLARGFLTFGGDSGHQAANADDATFARNDEALQNFGWMHIRKTLDAVRAVAQAHYGSAPRRVYFAGGSTGGREGLTAAIRWPEAYDGVLTNYPTASFMGLRVWGAVLARAVYEDESAGWIPPAMVARIASEAMARCDALDGVADGLVSNPDACRATAPAFLDSLRCRNGETGHPANCLTAAQIERTIAVYHQGYTLPYAFANGRRDYLGYNSLEGITMQLGSEAHYGSPPRSGPNAHHVNRAHEFFQNFVLRQDDYDLRRVDLLGPGPVRARIEELSAMIDANNGDFTRFAARGGKIIWIMGNDDPSVSPYENRRNYETLVARIGRAEADRFLRYFQIPGLAHGGGRFSPMWDGIGALDNWVENGTPPDGLVVTDGTRSDTRGRTRPLCAHPTWPKYQGGDVNQAASFACVAE